MAQIDDIRARFAELCKNSDFIQAYNDFNGTELKQLNQSQLFAVGTLFHLVQIRTNDDNEILITDCSFDLTYKGKLYMASGDFNDISAISEQKEINNYGMKVKLSNIRKEYIGLVAQGVLDNAEVQIDIGFMNPNTGSVEQSFNIFSGSIDSTTIQIQYEDNESKNTTDTQMNSLWEVLDKSARNHASDGVHRSYPGNENDSFFSRIGKWNSESKWTSVK